MKALVFRLFERPSRWRLGEEEKTMLRRRKRVKGQPSSLRARERERGRGREGDSLEDSHKRRRGGGMVL